MFGHTRVNDFPAIMGEDDRNVEQPKGRAGYEEHVDGGDPLGLVVQETAPSRRRRPSSSHHVLGNRGLADLNAELEQLAMNPRRSPERVGAAHLPNQFANFSIQRRPSGFRTPTPK